MDSDAATVIHWLLVALSAVAAAFVGVVAWNLRGAMNRLEQVEENKADKVDLTNKFNELVTNQREMMKRSDDMHAENRNRLDTILISLTRNAQR